MIVRELPSYLSVAHSLRYKEINHDKGGIFKIYHVIPQYLQLIKELINYRPSLVSFARNIQKLNTDFETINNSLSKGEKPICAYFVSANDHNGAIIGDPLYYYHHYKIKQFQKHYDVAAKVIKNEQQMYDHLQQLKIQHPTREIKVIDIVSHGDSDRLHIDLKAGNGAIYSTTNVQTNEFNTCADDAVIILDACSVGSGINSIAEKIAQMNPGKTVLAPAVSLYFSKPVFKTENQKTWVNHVVHGYAIVNAYTSRKFWCNPNAGIAT